MIEVPLTSANRSTLKQKEMDNSNIQDCIDDATYDFTLGESTSAIDKLTKISQLHPESFSVWLALSEVLFSEKQYELSLEAAENAFALNPNDIHINTSLSRIWVARGNKEKAEHYSAQVRMLGWKNELNNPPEKETL